MRFTTKTLVLCASLALLAGCSHFTKKSEEAGSAAANQKNGAKIENLAEGQSFTGQKIGTLGIQGDLTKTIHFGFDKFNLDTKAEKTAQGNANYLIQNPKIKVLIAGYTDPRGSQDYNFHLGQRRANAVKDYLLQQGVPEKQICTISYGELRPAATPDDMQGNWKKAYTLDRRAAFEYGKNC